jgi:hypothetical protein
MPIAASGDYLMHCNPGWRASSIDSAQTDPEQGPFNDAGRELVDCRYALDRQCFGVH